MLAPPEAIANGLRILLIHRASDSMLIHGLTREGHDVLAVDDQRPSRWLGVFKPDVVLVASALSISQTCRELRRCGAEPPVVAIEPDGEVRRRVAVLESGADDCLSSPINIDELNARVQAACRRGSRPTTPRRTATPAAQEGMA
jgi:DNA-binding response OmpR family regulator